MKRGFICGVFDLFHYGHILALRDCKKQCGHLTVALNKADNINPIINPGKHAPVFPIEHRVEIMKECKLVDEVLVYNSEKELEQLLQAGRFDIRFLGDDYAGRPITGEDLVPEIFFINRNHGFSTTYFKKLLGNNFSK